MTKPEQKYAALRAKLEATIDKSMRKDGPQSIGRCERAIGQAVTMLDPGDVNPSRRLIIGATDGKTAAAYLPAGADTPTRLPLRIEALVELPARTFRELIAPVAACHVGSGGTPWLTLGVTPAARFGGKAALVAACSACDGTTAVNVTLCDAVRLADYAFVTIDYRLIKRLPAGLAGTLTLRIAAGGMLAITHEAVTYVVAGANERHTADLRTMIQAAA